MPRRRRNDDWIELVAQAVGFLLLLSLISPRMRQILLAVGFVGFCVFGLAVVGLIGFGVYRWTTRSNRAPSNHNPVSLSVAYLNAPPIEVPRLDIVLPLQPENNAP